MTEWTGSPSWHFTNPSDPLQNKQRNSQGAQGYQSSVVSTQSISGRLVMCDYCDEAFTRQWNLKVHLRRKHGIGESLVCQRCLVKFRSRVKLSQHVYNIWLHGSE